MAAPQASSRLELLQARFQQKQLQEKEQKLLQLYDQQQQRAYQVVQRGSAGSNGSNHGSSISQHTVTRTSTSSHATSTPQGGKVRQMFDERRQTTVKGIDRSYPLEPLENKPRKQTNGNGVQRNGNLTVNRQSVTVKRVARSDVNSNLNGGKPVVSYHEEVTRESFGPSGEQHTDDDEFGNENHVAQYSNGNHREETRVGEVLNEDTIQRNRMMAKLHLMEYDETLKHRVKNDLESVQFPEDFMVDVPDKLPKQSGIKKVSQAEARLERFKNANARRSNSIAKNSSTISVPKRRSDPAFPAKPTSSGNEAVKSRTRKVLQKGLDTRKRSPQRGETLVSDSEGNPRRRNDSPKFFCKESEKSATTYAIDSKNSGRLSPDFSKDRGRRSASPKFVCKESEKSATTYAIDSKNSGRLSPDFSKDRGRRSASPKFVCKESEKSATTYAIDSKAAGKFSPDFSKGVKRTVVKIEPRGARTTFTELGQNVRKKSDKSAATMGVDTVDRDVKSSRTSSPESIKTEMIIHKKVQDKINTKPIRSGSQNVFDRLTKERRGSPKFLDRESEKLAAKMQHDDTKFTSKSPERTEKIVESRSDSPRVVSRKREASSIHASKRKSPDAAKRILRKASTSPQFFLTDSNRSSTIMLVTPETITKPRTDSAKSKKKTRTPGPSMNKSDVTLSSRITESSRRVSEEDAKDSSKYNIRSSVSRFFSEQCERASRNEDAGTGDSIRSTETGRSSDLSRGSSPVSLKDMKTPGPANRAVQLSSPRSQKIVDSRNAPAELVSYGTERSATTVKPKYPKHSIDERSKNPRSSKCKSSKTSGNFTVAKDAKITAGVGKTSGRGSSPGSMKMGDSRGGTPEFFCYESDKSATTVSFTPKSRRDSKGSQGPPSRPSSSTSVQPPGGSSKSPASFDQPEDVVIIPNIRGNSSREPSPRSQEIVDTRSGTAEFFCYESEKSATTVSLKPKSTKDSTNHRPKSPPSRPTSSTSVQPPGGSSKSPASFDQPKDVEIIPNIRGNSSREPSPRSQEIVDTRSGTAEFFCYESEKSATTVSLKPKSTKDSTNHRPKSPPSRPTSSTSVQPPGGSSKSPASFDQPKDVEIIPNIRGNSSREPSPRSQEIVDTRSGTAEFFCYESEKSATTVSLKPKSTKDSTNHRPKSPPSRPTSSTSVQPPGGSSKSPASFDQPKDVEIIPNIRGNSSREPSPRSQEIVDTRSGTAEFFCYESEKSATTVSLKPKSTKDSTNHRPKSPPSRPTSFTSVQPPGRSSKSPDFSPPKDSKAAARRGSNNVLRSTRLIRDIINRQKGGSRGDHASGRVAKESRRTAFDSAGGSIGGVELKHGSKVDEAEELGANRSVDNRATTPTTPAYELLAPDSTPSSSARVVVGTQEITMHDQYIKQERLQRGQLRSTYSRSFGKGTRESTKKPSTENLFTYPVRKSGKKRVSLFESSIFEPAKKDRQATDRALGSRRTRGSTRGGEEIVVGSRGTASSTERSCSSSPSSTNESVSRSLKRGLKENIPGQGSGAEALRSGRKTASPIFGESKKQRRSPTPHKQAQALRSIELVRRIMKGSQSERNEARREVCKTVASDLVVEEHETRSISEREIEGRKIESIASATGSITFASKDYERTDSVESALRRFDSIDTEAGVASARSTSGRSKGRGSTTEKRAEVESRGVAGSVDDSRAISLKALDQADVNVPPSPEHKLSRGTVKKASTASETAAASQGASKTQEARGRKKLAKARDSIEIARITARSKSPSCRRKLFPDVGSTEGSKTGGRRSGCSLESMMKTTERLSSRKKGRKSEVADSARAATRFVKHVKRADRGEEGEASTGVVTKRLRSIEDIRKSIGSESCRRRATAASSSLKSAIASDASRCSSPVQRRASSEDRVGNRKGLSLSKRSESLSGRSEASGDSEGSVKCATRSFRVTKSPSPDSTKATDTSGRPRRNVPSPPSKSPDTVTRMTVTGATPDANIAEERPSTDFKVQDTKPSKRPVPMKGTEPIGNRKTTTSTTTSTRKSTDVVDGAILENGLHLRDQTAETKYDNDSPTTKKSDAFVIEFDEQPSKENDGPPKKPLLRKQSTEKQTPPAQSGRPPSSVSSTSNGSSMQASVTRGKMASRARTPISGTASSKGSASSKGGASSCAYDSLVPCKMCGRRFAQDRVGLHEQICTKTGQKKRKQFDAMMYRVKGTELEPFVRRATCKKPEKSKKPEVKTNWRRKHEDFINTIRSAKQVQAHLAAGGKLSDLPPPPVSDTSDYIQCPHCGRKFNQCAAERHIPKCENMLHNKPVHLRLPKPRR